LVAQLLFNVREALSHLSVRQFQLGLWLRLQVTGNVGDRENKSPIPSRT
jgi:hypothetical protein